MNIIIYSPDFLPSYGGAEQYAYYIGRSLTSYCKVTVLTRAISGQKTREVIDGMNVIRLKPLQIPSYLFIMLAKERETVFQVNLAGYETFLCWPILKLFRTPTVLTYHGSQDTAKNETGNFAKMRVQDAMGTFFVTKIKWNKIVCVDKYGQSLLIKRLPKADIDFIPLGIDQTAFNASTCSSDDAELYKCRLVIFCPRRIDPKSGFNYLFEAIAKLKREYTNLLLIIAGRTEPHYEDYVEYLNRLIDKLDLNENVIFLGNVAHERMKSLYSLAKFVIMPSLAGGRSLSVQEAMACGKVVIAMNVGGIPEQIQNGVNGILIPPRDVEALYLAMSNLLSDENLMHRLSESASNSVQNSWETSALAYFKVYCEVL